MSETPHQQSRDELQAIYDGMVEGLLIADVETKRFIRANPAICQMLGYSEKELLSLSVMDIHPTEILPTVLEKFQAQAEGRIRSNENTPILRKDGTIFPADITGEAISYGGRPCLIKFFRDITERKKAQEILLHLLEVSDHERHLISCEIHDGLAQQLAGALMQFEAYKCLQEKNSEQAAKAYDLGVQMLRDGHVEARRLVGGLRLPQLEDGGVVAAIKSLVEVCNERNKAKIEFCCNVVQLKMAPILENTVFCIVQECIANACRYSKSKKVKVELTQHDGQLRVAVRDWGIGFEVDRVYEGHFGLEGIQERARVFGGRVVIKSAPRKGTAIVVELPLNPASATVSP